MRSARASSSPGPTTFDHPLADLRGKKSTPMTSRTQIACGCRPFQESVDGFTQAIACSTKGEPTTVNDSIAVSPRKDGDTSVKIAAPAGHQS